MATPKDAGSGCDFLPAGARETMAYGLLIRLHEQKQPSSLPPRVSPPRKSWRRSRQHRNGAVQISDFEPDHWLSRTHRRLFRWKQGRLGRAQRRIRSGRTERGADRSSGCLNAAQESRRPRQFAGARAAPVQPPYFFSPATQVSLTLMSPSFSGFVLYGSDSRITRSASLPFSSDPMRSPRPI